MWKKLLVYFVVGMAIAIFHGANVSSKQINLIKEPLMCECFNATAPDQCKENKIQCEQTEPDKQNFCFVLWSTDNNTGSVNVSMKGCFTNNDVCNQTECVDHAPEIRKNYNFCCCNGNMCNTEQKWLPTTTKATEVEIVQQVASKVEYLQIVIICSIVCLTIGGGFFANSFIKNKRTAMFNEIPTNEPDISGSSLTLNNPRPIQLIEQKARGRFGAVWRAQFKLDEVAVKIFPMQDKESWKTEQEIFKLARMRHPNILEYIGVEKHPSEFWLITAYHNYGSLCDYLKAHTVTWSELCKIAETMARGLTHLHEEFASTKNDGLKPAVAHRDFKSKNVLLKDDLTACIADFGLALIFEPGKPCGDAHGQVGTRRYMAPEVLEGAINFTRDAFLRIDVYACGLVLWELVSRCSAHDGIVEEYRLPFETELGTHPTVEEMQENVVTKKMRPNISEKWRTHNGLNAMCDTMEECWDHDAEARLSSSCVMERISQHTKYQITPLFIETNTDTSIKNNTDSM